MRRERISRRSFAFAKQNSSSLMVRSCFAVCFHLLNNARVCVLYSMLANGDEIECEEGDNLPAVLREIAETKKFDTFTVVDDFFLAHSDHVCGPDTNCRNWSDVIERHLMTPLAHDHHAHAHDDDSDNAEFHNENDTETPVAVVKPVASKVSDKDRFADAEEGDAKTTSTTAQTSTTKEKSAVCECDHHERQTNAHSHAHAHSHGGHHGHAHAHTHDEDDDDNDACCGGGGDDDGDADDNSTDGNGRSVFPCRIKFELNTRIRARLLSLVPARMDMIARNYKRVRKFEFLLPVLNGSCAQKHPYLFEAPLDWRRVLVDSVYDALIANVNRKRNATDNNHRNNFVLRANFDIHSETM
jgi:hypothetical protein